MHNHNRLIDYYNFVISSLKEDYEDSIINLNAHGIVYKAIIEKGIKYDKNNEPIYLAFEEYGEIYGISNTIRKIVNFIKSSAFGQDTMKRILLLLGPPGSSKSTIVNTLKILLEEHTRNNPVASVKNCPNHCNPLYLLPIEEKVKLKKLGVNIEENYLPCPVCQKTILENNWQDIEIEYISFSRMKNIGISTYAPGDPNTVDDSLLIGSFSLAKFSMYKSDTDPRVWNYNGVLQTGNRGIIEFAEILKAKTEHLNILLTASQDKMIVLKGLGSYNIDAFLIGHTNIPEYEQFINRPDTTAFRDRLYIIKIPYNVNYLEEKKIIKKLVKEINKNDPMVYDIAGYFSVASRLVYYDKIKTIDRLSRAIDILAYSGEQENANIKKESMNDDEIYQSLYNELEKNRILERGLSPRRIADVLSEMNIKASEGLSSVELLEEFRNKFYNDQLDMQLCLDTTSQFLDNLASSYVLNAFLGTDIENEINTLFKSYYNNLRAYVQNKKLVDKTTGREYPINDELLTEIDKILGIPSNKEQRKAIFERITTIMSEIAFEGEREFILKKDMPDLYNALKQYLFKEKLKLFGSSINIDMPIGEQKGIIKEIIDNLVEQGFTERTAKIILKRLENLFKLK